MLWRALYLAMEYVPKEEQDRIRSVICEDCRYNDGEEQLACCWCQEGSMFEKSDRKIQRCLRRRTPVIEQSIGESEWRD